MIWTTFPWLRLPLKNRLALQSIPFFSGCGGDLKEQSGNITSPNYPMSFPAFSDCVWRIKVPTDRYISLRFLVFTGINGANSECSLDSIEVRDGYSSEAPLIGNIS